MYKPNKISDLLKKFNETFVKNMMLKVISISYFSAFFFTVVFDIFYFFTPILNVIANLLLIYTITLGIAYRISASKIKKSYNISSILLLIADVFFVASIFSLTPIGMLGIYHPTYNFIFMMFIAFTIFTPNFIYALLHSMSYATLASFFYIWNFKAGSSIILLNFSTLSLITFPLLYYFTAALVSYYVWYRNSHYSNVKTFVQNNLITSAHKKMITNDEIISGNWHILTAIINIEADLFGGDFISHKNKKDSIEIIIGDVLDHGVDSSQIAFGLMSIFHSKKERHPEETLINCHEFLRTIGVEEGGMAYIAIICLDKNSNVCTIYGNTGVYPILITSKEHKEINTKNFIFGVNIDIETVDFKTIELSPSDMLILKTDGWDSEFDEKASVMIGYNNDRYIA